ncbi:MAG TPA: TIGR03619 family F420-dependent LLM class oxidoreductase [Micromonospora sp.]
MRIGFGIPMSGSWATPANMLRVARRAEELGYHSLWTFQRVLYAAEAGWAPTYRSVHDPIVTMTLVAAHTERIRVGAAVLNLPFVSPVLLAKQLTTLDIVSNGRLDVGLGLGWAPEEFVATGAEMRSRGRRAEEFIAVLRALWTREVVEYDGRFYRVPPAIQEPKPVQRPHPPILLGGSAPEALRRAGAMADGWISSSRADLTAIGESIAIVKAAAEEAGRDPAALRFICRGAVMVRPKGVAERKPLTGTLEEIRADLDDLAAQGVTEVFLDLNFDPEVGAVDADPVAAMRRAEELLEACAPGR